MYEWIISKLSKVLNNVPDKLLFGAPGKLLNALESKEWGDCNNLCCNCDPGALLWELFDPRLLVDADSDTSPLPFCKINRITSDANSKCNRMKKVIRLTLDSEFFFSWGRVEDRMSLRFVPLQSSGVVNSRASDISSASRWIMSY